MKTIVTLLDGVGDLVCDELGEKTPLEYANTPNLDRMASLGETGIMIPYRLGVPIGTDFAHYRLLGYQEESYPGRSIVDGLAFDVPLHKDRLYMVTSWASVYKEENYEIQTRYLMDLSKEDSLEIGRILPGSFQGYGLHWHYTNNGHGILEISGNNVTTKISDPDGIYPLGYVLQSEPYGTIDPEAKSTSGMINELMKEVHRRLKDHPVNKKREEQGLEPANFLLPKWAGTPGEILGFAEENGMAGEIIGSSAMIRGIARLLKMEYTPYNTFAEGVEKALASSAEYIHLHTKETDQAAHTKDPFQKVKVLEKIDPLLAPLIDYGLKEDVLLIVTGDHTTPSIGPMIHSGDPVPIVFLGKQLRVDDVQRFDERSCTKGSIRMKGEDFIPMILNYHGRSLFHDFRVGGRKSKYLPSKLNKL